MKKYSASVFLVLFLNPLPVFSHYDGAAEADNRFFSGDTISRTLSFEDFSPGGDIECRWATLVETAVIEKGLAMVKQSAGRGGDVRVTLHLPEVQRQAKLTWAVAFRSGDTLLGDRIFPFHIFPRDNAALLREVLRGMKIGLFDPGGEVKDLFTSLGIGYSEVTTDLSLLFFRGDALIIGPGAVTNTRSNLFHLLAKNSVITGGILCLRQNVPTAELSFRMLSRPLSRVAEPTIIAPGHPVFSGLSAEDFHNWRGEDEPARPLNTPFGSNCRALLELPAAGVNREGSLLLEDNLDGRPVLFCQLPVCESFSSEPVAGILLANMLRYITMPSRRFN